MARSSETKEAEKVERAKRARRLHARLMALPRPADLSNNDWAKQAGVSTSFFSNLQDGSEPSIHNLRKILDVIGVTLSEFFLDEAQARVTRRPSEQELEGVFRDAWKRRPKDEARMPEFLTATVGRVLAPHSGSSATPSAEGDPEPGAPGEVAPPRKATK